tara:strand:+ start:260 stop:514 length:255 start_codon:yes stop_codon:yes gene_type:complete
MAMVADERTSVFGNFHVVTGTYESGGGTLDLSGQFSSIVSFVATADGAVPSAANEPRVSNNSLTVGITSAAGAQTGTWIAIGKR